MKYIGGYSILDLTDANVSVQANICYNQDKPVLVYGANGERYFADTIEKVGTSIIITKGGKTITIANDNTITNVGDIQTHLYEHRIDLYGDDTNGNTYQIRIIINNTSNTKLVLSNLINERFNGLIVDNAYLTRGIEEIEYVDAEETQIELYSIFDNESLELIFNVNDLSFNDTITKLF